ncbi:MAG: oligopeptide transporter periplasmic oligopeptide-binding protein [Gammaproteobacteria bacterium]|nr:oligopeptide transporter periplasmic oligopeptide-binding protein [Gammaproteobacteria bacterium]
MHVPAPVPASLVTHGPKSRVVLRRGNGPEPESLDPHAARSEAALTILRDLYEGLTAIGADGTPVLAAADRCDISPDGKIYRFHLRSAARWSNGDPVVAEDFVAAWRRLVDPHTGAQYADILGPVRGASAISAGSAAPATLGVRADDPQTLVVALTHPTPYFLSVLAHPATFPLNRGSLALHGRRFAKPGVMVSNGAFVFTRWDFGSHLVAARNAMYWNDEATRVDGVEYHSFADAASELRAFRTGQVDVTSTIPAAQLGWVKQHLGRTLHVAPQLAVYYLGLNVSKPPFDRSRQLRQALSLVIDRERLVQSVTGAGESPAYTFVPPGIFDYSPPVPEYAAWPMAQRIARAKSLLREAGMEANPPTVEIRFNSGELHSRIAIAVARMWKDALGINVAMRAEEFKVLLQDIGRGDVTVFRASWLADYNDAYGFLQVLRSGFGINLPHYSNPAFDDFLGRASEEGNAPRRRQLLQEAEALMLADQPLIPLYFYVSKHLVDAHIRGWQDNAMNVVYSKNLSKTDAGRDE